MRPILIQDGPVWTINVGDDENRFSQNWLDGMEEAVDAVGTSVEPAVLVTTGDGKFFSNGLDLDWLGAHPDEMGPYVARVQRLFAAVLALPVPTVAALNGHTFAAGAMLALAHDYRVMRDDRGYFCLPEVDIRIPFTVGMSALIQSKLSPRAAVDSMTTGRRYDAPSAVAAGIVDAAASLDDLRSVATGMVRDLVGKDRTTLGTIKRTMFAHVLEALEPAKDRPPV